MVRSKTLQLLLLAVLSDTSSAQVLSLRWYSQNEGLLSNGVNTLYQDSRRHIWIGTNEGVSVYDGKKFVNYTPVDGLALNYVNCIIEAGKQPGTFYIGTNGGGISKLLLTPGIVTPRFSTIRLDSGLTANRVHSIVQDINGTFWCLTGSGIYTIHNDSVSRFPLQRTENASIAVSRDGQVWIGAGVSLYRYDPRTSRSQQYDLSRWARLGISDVFADRSGDVWVVTADNSLHRFRDSIVVGTRQIPGRSVEQVLEDEKGNMWLCTRDGLLTIPKSGFITASWLRYSTANGFRSNNFKAGMFDHEGNLWLSAGSGAVRWTMRNLSIFPFSMGHVYNNSSVAIDSSNHLWVASNEGLSELWMSSEGEWHSRTHATTPKQAVQCDAQGRLWMSLMDGTIRCYNIIRTASGSSRLDNVTPEYLNALLPTGDRLCFAVDNGNRFWCSMQGTGVVVVDLDKGSIERTYSTLDGLGDNSVRVLYEDMEARMWLAGFNGGIAVVSSSDPQRTLVAHRNDGLPEGGIRAIVQDRQERIWMGTRYGGLALWDDGQVRVFTMHDGLMSNAIWSLAYDGDSTLWIGTASGLQSMNLATFEFSSMPMEFKGAAVYSCGVSNTKILWMGTNRNLNLVNLSASSSKTVPPPIRITRFEVNGVSRQLGDVQVLAYDQNTCVFEFHGISFVDAEAVRYQYRLVGVDQEWHPPTHEYTVTYASLPPGEYRLEVRALNAEGTASARPALFDFTIIPPYWRTGWFQTATVLAALLATGTVVRWRFATLKQRAQTQLDFSHKLLELQEAERKRIAAGLHDSLGQNLLVLKNALQQSSNSENINGGLQRELSSLADLAQQSLNEVREVSFDLHPHVLDRLGLRRAVETMVDKITQASSIVIAAEFDRVPDRLPGQIEINIYRITQEALSNIVKHSGATTARLRFEATEGMFGLHISDNGHGFDVESHLRRPPEQWSLGLLNIAERVQLLHGTYTLSSVSDKGTSLIVHVPLIHNSHG